MTCQNSKFFNATTNPFSGYPGIVPRIRRNPNHEEYERMTLAAAFAAGNGTKKATVSGTGAPDGIHVHFGRDPNKRVTVTTNASPTSVSTTGSGGKKGKKKGMKRYG